ncbi:MAG TPA: branched-chain amino acid ABC transporter ATP-binding protein/permease [bacterium]|nr:branched-chain amino acid ABC transporter ATP-binding protein/permease [bacterium]
MIRRASVLGYAPWMIAGGLALILMPLLIRDTFLLNAMILVFLFGAMAQGWNLIGGYAGQVSFGHAVFFGIGAYAAAILLGQWGLSPWIGAWVGAALSTLVALAVGYPTFRLRRHFFALATLALGEIARISFLNWKYVGAAIGLYLPLQYRNQLAYLMWDSKAPYYLVTLALCALATVLVAVLDRNRSGTYLRGINQDEDAADMLGIPTRRYKLYAMALSAAVASLCGTVYALYVLYIDPYNVMAGRISLLIVVIALIGGRATIWGPVLGAVFIVLLNEYTRSWLGGAGSGADFILFGLLIVLVSIREPRGIVGILRRHAPTPVLPIEGAAGEPHASSSERPRAPAQVASGAGVLLAIHGLHKRFGGVHAVRDATLEVRRGEILGLIGPNGAGKSTLFECVTGFLRPEAGEVHLGDVRLTGLPPHQVAWSGVARTFQAMRVFAELTAWENLMSAQEHRAEGLWEASLSRHPQAVQERGQRLLMAFGLWDLRDLPAGALSYGQQKLLSIAMAVLRQPPLVLLDEPAAGVNPVLVGEIARHIRDLNASGMTFLVIEHNMEMIMGLAHRIAFMAEGQVVTVGRPDEIRRNQKVLDLYYGQ